MNLLEDAENEKEEDQDTKECKELFKNFKFFSSREVPRESLLFVIPAFGGIVSWDGDDAPFKEEDEAITHQIVDRPAQGHRYLSREYIQPVWVFDCVNARIILPTDGYVVGRIPSPHLLIMRRKVIFLTMQKLSNACRQLGVMKFLQCHVLEKKLWMIHNLLLEGYISHTEANEATERKRKMETLEKQYHEELRMEVEGKNPSSSSKKIKQVSADDADTMEGSADLEQVAKDIENMSTVVMSPKKRGLLKAIQTSKERKQAQINKLKERKKILANPESGKN